MAVSRSVGTTVDTGSTYLRVLLHRAERKLGVELRRGYSDNAHHRRARVLRHARITLVLDGGANCGQYGIALRKHSAYRNRIVSFEPVAAAFAELSAVCAPDPLWECCKQALADSSGVVAMGVAPASHLSSLLAARALEDGAPLDATASSEEMVETVRLDEVAGDIIGPHDRTMLKLDVQGFEKRALEGSLGVLDRLDLLECELSFVALYEDQPTLREMIEWIDDAGFDPIGVEPNYGDPVTGALADADFVFRRRKGP